jgi:hypothetical protein
MWAVFSMEYEAQQAAKQLEVIGQLSKAVITSLDNEPIICHLLA